MNPKTKPVAQLSLEAILEKNKAEAKRLSDEASARLAENARIETEMQRILSEPPASSRLVAAYKNGAILNKLAAENASTIPVTDMPPQSTKMIAEREVLYAALAIVRSWQRRHKKKFNNQERELTNAVERLTWE